MWIALLSDSPWLNSSGTLTGQYSEQAPQPVHLSSKTYLGVLVRVTLKSPASPSTLLTSVRVITSMLGCRLTSLNLGDWIHIEQSLVGKVLSSWDILPPIACPFSTR